MNWQIAGRAISIAAGAATLFGLRAGLGLELYIAIGGGILVYALLRAAFAVYAAK